ncbi:hypothetical protein [Marininema halotolerans]|uniref:Uncharacterized protein n=1 Tax=Marininema halotolerans TaxID=1155944 RepID=A0A1I6URB0_9BACL|nr:hypothetical protein [Marininema halotolerans]SFT03877.1 hypothetical protein SAMN05444972_11920 [Marininema halotolerans]
MKSVTYKIGNTTIYIEGPDITNEEREQRIYEIKKIIWENWCEMRVETQKKSRT